MPVRLRRLDSRMFLDESYGVPCLPRGHLSVHVVSFLFVSSTLFHGNTPGCDMLNIMVTLATVMLLCCDVIIDLAPSAG